MGSGCAGCGSRPTEWWCGWRCVAAVFAMTRGGPGRDHCGVRTRPVELLQWLSRLRWRSWSGGRRWRGARRRSGRRCGLGLAVDDQSVDDPQAEGEDRDRPERIGRDRQQRADRGQGANEDCEPPAVGATAEQRYRREELQDPEDQRDPAPPFEAGEDLLRVMHEEARVPDRGDPLDDVQHPAISSAAATGPDPDP